MSTRYNGAFVVDMGEEVEDPSPQIEKDCHTPCVSVYKAYEACAERIEGKDEGHCTGQYLDYWHCVDKCSAAKKFAYTRG
mmetsp:Transcript_13690/g.40367  ORF Transcript_13690/g.40367 Transcript_13690/m.40367 type:complete len:80 (+) Transcript_13690:54-293(+)